MKDSMCLKKHSHRVFSCGQDLRICRIMIKRAGGKKYGKIKYLLDLRGFYEYN